MPWARLFLLFCAVFVGAELGGCCMEKLLSLRKAPLTLRADAEIRSFPANSSVLQDVRMNVNEAAAEDFQRANGIGPALAQAILDYRAEVGGFLYLEELLDVPGIGPARFQALKELFFCPSDTPAENQANP